MYKVDNFTVEKNIGEVCASLNSQSYLALYSYPTGTQVKKITSMTENIRNDGDARLVNLYFFINDYLYSKVVCSILVSCFVERVKTQ